MSRQLAEKIVARVLRLLEAEGPLEWADDEEEADCTAELVYEVEQLLDGDRAGRTP
jgi:hypothetical protein